MIWLAKWRAAGSMAGWGWAKSERRVHPEWWSYCLIAKGEMLFFAHASRLCSPKPKLCYDHNFSFKAMRAIVLATRFHRAIARHLLSGASVVRCFDGGGERQTGRGMRRPNHNLIRRRQCVQDERKGSHTDRSNMCWRKGTSHYLATYGIRKLSKSI